jgi:hypothetical protein
MRCEICLSLMVPAEQIALNAYRAVGVLKIKAQRGFERPFLEYFRSCRIRSVRLW